MNDVELNEHRIARLMAAINHVCKGNKTEFGRRLGYKDGAFVRQMLSGIRPITEKTVRAVEDMPGMRKWFDADSTLVNTPVAIPWPFSNLTPEQWAMLNEHQRGRAEGYIWGLLQEQEAIPAKSTAYGKAA